MTPNQKLQIDLRIVCGLLLVAIIVMLGIWRPWTAPLSDDRTVQVTGEAKVSAEPDQYVFMPTYTFEDADKAKALLQATAKSDEVITKLKELGVKDSDIKADTTNYEKYYYFDRERNVNSYNLQFTVTAHSRDEAQKIQDYLISTTPTGSVSPQATFSDEKHKDLETEARNKATQDARAKADQSASNLGFKIAKVKSVTDDAGFGGMPYGGAITLDAAATSTRASLPVQPGENELSYSVTVVYFVR